MTERCVLNHLLAHHPAAPPPPPSAVYMVDSALRFHYVAVVAPASEAEQYH
jgi:hypothetical protein